MRILTPSGEWRTMSSKIPVAILGTGNIGSDLCHRMLLDSDFEVVALVGRRASSPGLDLFRNKVEHLVSTGIEGLLPIMDKVEGIFDATSANDHAEHWAAVSNLGKWAIDLTPSKIGKPVVPSGGCSQWRTVSNRLASARPVADCGSARSGWASS